MNMKEIRNLAPLEKLRDWEGKIQVNKTNMMPSNRLR